MILSVLINFIQQLKTEPDIRRSSIYDSEDLPNMSEADYVMRIITYCDSNEDTIVHCLNYIEKWCSVNYLSQYNFHRVFCTCYILAIKFVCDDVYNYSHYAKVFGLTKIELSDLEIETLKLFDYNICVKDEDYARIKKMICG
jgi:hypothetical protein